MNPLIFEGYTKTRTLCFLLHFPKNLSMFHLLGFQQLRETQHYTKGYKLSRFGKTELRNIFPSVCAKDRATWKCKRSYTRFVTVSFKILFNHCDNPV